MKLTVRARHLPALRRALVSRGGAGAARSRLVSTYFDTADQALARRGLTLRVREKDGSFVQTVKSDAAAGATALVRGEWEDKVAGARPDPQAVESGRFLDRDLVGRLIPLFHTEVDRATWVLAPSPGSLIEAAIDRGRIHAPIRDLSEPICEIELELKSGSPAALYDLALDLLALAPLRVERRSKAERGHRLVSGMPAAVEPVHGAAVELAPELSGDDALRRIGSACLDQVVANEAAVFAGIPEGIHQMRIAVRRLRAVLSAFGRLLPDDPRRAASTELRWLADALGPARNLDVFETSLLAPAHGTAADHGAVAALVEAAERRRQAAYRKAVWAVRSRRYTALLLNQRRWFEGCAWRGAAAAPELAQPIADLAGPILERQRRAAKRRGRHFAGQSERERHRLRIAFKKLRYASEMLAPLFPANAVGRFIKPLKRLQDDLGEANDIRVGHAIVRGLARSKGADGAIAEAGESVLGWHKHRLGRREPRLRKHLDRVFDTEPFWQR